MTRFEALQTLYERVKGVPGNIVELGVASGASLRAWDVLIGPDARMLWGFDTFAGFPSFSPEDGPLMPAIGKRVGGETELRLRPLKVSEVNAPHATLIVGDIVETLSSYADVLKPALVFFDCDLYAPTKCGIDLLWPRLSPGGLFVFDEYGHEPWPGETKAVDDFVTREGLALERFSFPYGPAACVVKPR